MLVLEEVGGERLTEGVGRGPLGDTGLPSGDANDALQDRFVRVVAASLASLAVGIDAGGREYPLPGPLPAGVGILPREGGRWSCA